MAAIAGSVLRYLGLAGAAGKPGAERKDIYQTIGRLDLLNRALGAAGGTLPQFQHGIKCTIVGGPGADIRRLWYLCVSVVYGRFRNRVRVFGVPFSSQATWDISGKAVDFEIYYTANSLTEAIGGTGRNGLADPGSSGSAYLIRGPEQLTIGGGWNAVFSDPVNRVLAAPALGLGGLSTIPNLSLPIFGGAPPGGFVPAWVASLTAAAGGCIGFGGRAGNVAIYVTNFASIDGPTGFDNAPGVEAIRPLRELPVGGFTSSGGFFSGLRGGLVGGVLGASTNLSVSPGGYPYRVLNAFPPSTPGPTVASPTPNRFPVLPDENRVITTNEKYDPRVQPPKPHLDGSTRSGYLALVAAALQTPCFLPFAPPCTTNRQSAGLFVQPFGTPTSNNPATLAALWGLRSTPGTWPLAVTQGPDGYPQFPPGTPIVGGGSVTNYGG